MKQMFRLIMAVVFMAVAATSYAADNKDITLIVTSDGATKDEAIKNALRSAIEQTYGVFVSDNTEILNDEIVRDEVVTVASGNIKSYKELSVLQSEDKTTVTIEVVVSVGKLISYAKSKGAECEFDGEALGQDIELKLLFKKNEEKAIENLLATVRSQMASCFDYTVTMDKIVFSDEEKSWAHGYNIPDFKTTFDDENVSVPYKVSAVLNAEGAQVLSVFFSNLAQIGEAELTAEEERENRRRAEEEISKIKKPTPKITFSAKVLEMYEQKMREYGDSVAAVYKKYGIGVFHADNSELPYSYDIPSANNNRRIHFRSKKSVDMLKAFLSCTHICEFNKYLEDFYLTYNDGKVISKQKDGYRGYYRDSRASSDYALQSNMWHGLPSFCAGQAFYFYLSRIVMPQTELKKIKTVKLHHN